MLIVEDILRRFKGKTALIVGGRRVGQVVAKALAELGVNIIVTYRDSQKEAMATVVMAKKFGVKALALKMDASTRESVQDALGQVKKTFKKIDILLVMPSVFGVVAFDDVSPEDLKKNIDAHLYGTFWPVQIFSRIMPKGSTIVNVSDRTSSGRVYTDYSPYVISKIAVTGITRTASTELASKGIIVNEIAPGPLLRPPHITLKEWQSNRKSPLSIILDDAEAQRQFAWLVVYLSQNKGATGYTYFLDQGKNL